MTVLDVDGVGGSGGDRWLHSRGFLLVRLSWRLGRGAGVIFPVQGKVNVLKSIKYT